MKGKNIMAKKKAAKADKKEPVIKTDTISARHNFSDEERQALGMDLATAVETKARLTEEKKVAVKDWSNRIEIVQNKINSVSGKISSGFEFRDVECEVHYDWKKGTKTFVSKESGKEIETRKIDDTERQQKLWDDEQEKKKSEPKDGKIVSVAAALAKAEDTEKPDPDGFE